MQSSSAPDSLSPPMSLSAVSKQPSYPSPAEDSTIECTFSTKSSTSTAVDADNVAFVVSSAPQSQNTGNSFYDGTDLHTDSTVRSSFKNAAHPSSATQPASFIDSLLPSNKTPTADTASPTSTTLSPLRFQYTPPTYYNAFQTHRSFPGWTSQQSMMSYNTTMPASDASRNSVLASGLPQAYPNEQPHSLHTSSGAPSYIPAKPNPFTDLMTHNVLAANQFSYAPAARYPIYHPNQLGAYPKLNPDRPRLTSFSWEDEGTLCYQVDVNGIIVARRQDNSMVNGTKLLNVTGMTRGKRDGILKNERGRVVVKVGAMHLKGVWITFQRARALATQHKIADLLFPLFVDNPTSYLVHTPPSSFSTPFPPMMRLPSVGNPPQNTCNGSSAAPQHQDLLNPGSFAQSFDYSSSSSSGGNLSFCQQQVPAVLDYGSESWSPNSSNVQNTKVVSDETHF